MTHVKCNPIDFVRCTESNNENLILSTFPALDGRFLDYRADSTRTDPFYRSPLRSFHNLGVTATDRLARLELRVALLNKPYGIPTPRGLRHR